MGWRRYALVLVTAVTAWATATPALQGQQRNTTVGEALAGLDMLAKTLPAAGDVNAGLARIALDSLKARAMSALTAPATLNRTLEWAERGHFLNGVLQPLKLKFATFQTTGGESLLGLQYDWTEDLVYDSIHPFSTGFFGFTGTAKANGTVAFGGTNPRDLLDSQVSLNAFGVWGGTIPSEVGWFDRLNSLEDSLTTYTSLDALEASGVFDEFFGQVWSRLTTQLYLSTDLSGGLEASQSFDRSQSVFGGHLGVDVKAWNPHSTLAKLNVIDWPAAILRYLLGVDTSVRPLGTAIPTVVMGLERIDPSGDPIRVATGESDPFYRVSAEVTYRSPIASMSGGSLYLEGWVRLYHELGAPAAVTAADLASFREATVTLRAPNGMYVAYSAGRLPFDQESTRLFHVGFQYDFKRSVPGG